MTAEWEQTMEAMFFSHKSTQSVGRGAQTPSVRQIAPVFIALFFWAASASSIFAQTNQWAVKMFSELGTERAHNFGSVALNATVEKHFPFKNIYDEDVVVASVSSNCGCTKATVSKQVVRPGETAEIIARVDTSGREHTKQRKATIRVVFSQPTAAEVQLQVKTYIRSDVGFEPGIIEFGSVQAGESIVKKAYLQYEGRHDWALVGIQKNSAAIRAEAREVKRRGSSVIYEILVELKSDAAPGYIQDLLRFQTNDPDPMTSSVFLPIQAHVVEALSAKPSFLQLGVVEHGQKVTKNVVVSGSTPFKIVGVKSADERIEFTKTDLNRTVHVVPITFTANDETGDFSTKISIITSLTGDDGARQSVSVQLSGHILEAGRLSARKAALQGNNVSADEEQETPTSLPEASKPASSKGKEPISVDDLNDDFTEDSPKTLRQPSIQSKVRTSAAASAVKYAEKVEDDFGWVASDPENCGSNKATAPSKEKTHKKSQGEWVSGWKEVPKVNAYPTETAQIRPVPSFTARANNQRERK